jgi:hypothetical protein
MKDKLGKYGRKQLRNHFHVTARYMYGIIEKNQSG